MVLICALPEIVVGMSRKDEEGLMLLCLRSEGLAE